MGKATEMIEDLTRKLDAGTPPAPRPPIHQWEQVLGNVARLRVPGGWAYRAVAGMCHVPDPCFEVQWECYVPECYNPAGLKRDPRGPCRAHARHVKEVLEAEEQLGHSDVIGALS